MLADFPEEVRGAAGTATAPTTGTAIASLAAPPAGFYKVTVMYQFSGTAETLVNNIRLVWNNVTKLAGLPSLAAFTGPYSFVIERADLDGINPLKISANGNATAGAVYTAFITAQRIG
jgi:hypothetical protein